MSAGWTNFSVGNGSHNGDDDGPSVVGEDQPACASCKKRKLRCSRDTPVCSHCLRLSTECVYNPKQKPGLKPGAVEALTRRVAFLEKILLDESGNIRPQYNGEPEHQADVDIPRYESRANVEDPAQSDNDVTAPPPKELPPNSVSTHEGDTASNPLKRKYVEPEAERWLFATEELDLAQHLPSQAVLLKVVDFFTTSFHHWIPYLHKKRLQSRVSEGICSNGLLLVLHALVAVALRHMDPNVLFMDEDEIQRQSSFSRIIVETHAIRSVSVESLQALIFIVFDYLNDGKNHRAWPLIGSLTRTIGYLQLSTEPSAASQSSLLMRPVRLAQPSNDWTELEERRRLFWIIFMLDRFCSVTTGWDTSLTSDDVHRRLPADGGYFTREEPVVTPYFGIWNKAAARIGRSLANVPAPYSEEDPVAEQPQGASPNSANGYIDASKLGAFAYCVEATESLSQVTTFFLQQRINAQDKEHAVSWLTRFKELDLRLVQWKLFLPARWKDSNISEDRTVINMDPNLTLAHITHNTSMILLHHPIAFPARSWNDYVALPKECSAQTCELAAIETSNIVSKFLIYTPIPFVNVQFAFCAFVAAKALLFERHQSPLRPEFGRIVRDLWEMSKRWEHNAASDAESRPANQAGIYAQHLERLQEACSQDPNYRFDFYDHTCTSLEPQQYVSPMNVMTPLQRTGSFAQERPNLTHARHHSLNSVHTTLSPRQRASLSGAAGASPIEYAAQPSVHGPNLDAMSPRGVTAANGALHPNAAHSKQGRHVFHLGHGVAPGAHFNGIPGAPGNQQAMQDQSLLSLSDTFMDSQFLDMDRVITFEEANFFLPGDAYRWQ
ncbi:fungal-specific transcription factor domain-containing protein [Boeremia exigua]|uniref:fungal-specific transcription factor domain-containing protein n=1 Tax=Boeremia exigua TaxID=749465 RepID=UPI001E8D38A9|nr:fungal-specific transcription factor domain-containing protein [Boeremia exigua]KAH6632952.1 fungal-specific transcription factor domain-containing protein [Boeremia exigua]